MRRWWHAGRGVVTVCEIDLRVGGKWRYVSEVTGYGEVGFHGEYREVVENERLVTTEAFEGIPDADANASVNTLTLTEADGRTKLTVLVDHATQEGRDMHIASGMEAGLGDALDLLEGLVTEGQRPRTHGEWGRALRLDPLSAGWKSSIGFPEVVEEDLAAARAGDDVVAEADALSTQALDLGLDVRHDQVDAVPAAGAWLSPVGHRPARRARGAAEQQAQRTRGPRRRTPVQRSS